jgi:hypothetical protein
MVVKNYLNILHLPVRKLFFYYRTGQRMLSIGEQELSRSLILIIQLLELVTINSQQMLQTDKSSTFTFCQTPIERIVTDATTKDLFPNIMK